MTTISPRRRGLALGTLVLAGLLIAAAVAVEALVEPPQRGPAEPVVVPAPASGAAYCPVTAAAEETAVLSVAPAEAEPTSVRVTRYTEEGPVTDEGVEIAPGTSHEVVLADGQAARPVSVRWSGGPAVTTWRVEGRDSAGAPCEPAPSAVWHVAGFDTTARNQGRLHLFNPFAVDAVARVVFGTPTGRITRVATENILVPANASLVLDMNEHEPEQPDLAATVEVLVGRLVVQGESTLRPTEHQPGPSGRTLLPGAGEPLLESAFAYGRADETASSWLVVYNPGDREAAIELRVSDPLPDAQVVLGEMSIPAGGVARIDLAESSATAEFGTSLVGVNEVPVVATRLTTVRTPGGAEGAAASPGFAPASAWAIAGGGGRDRHGRVSLYNPGGESVTVAVDAGDETPEEWAQIVLEPNGRHSLELDQAAAERAAVGLRATGDGPFIVDLRTQSAGENLRYWTATWVASHVWEGPGVGPPVHRDERLGTTRTATPASPSPPPGF